MSKTVAQLGWLIQRLVEGGVIRTDTKLDEEDYTDLVFAARDYLLYQRKISGFNLINGQTISPPKDYIIDVDKKVELEKGFSVQGIDGAVLIDGSGNEMSDLLMPMSPSSSALISDSIFTYYLPNTKYITFKNLPTNAKKLRVFRIAGSSPDDIVSDDITFMIIQQIFKLGMDSEKGVADTSADGNTLNDYQKSQVRQMLNQPNEIV